MDSEDPWKRCHQIKSRDRDFDDDMDAIGHFSEHLCNSELPIKHMGRMTNLTLIKGTD